MANQVMMQAKLYKMNAYYCDVNIPLLFISNLLTQYHIKYFIIVYTTKLT